MLGGKECDILPKKETRTPISEGGMRSSGKLKSPWGKKKKRPSDAPQKGSPPESHLLIINGGRGGGGERLEGGLVHSKEGGEWRFW